MSKTGDNEPNRLEEALAQFEADEPRRRMMRAAVPRADYEQWCEYADALQRDREALALARQSGALDVDELAEALDNVLQQMHFMARACRNSLAHAPREIRELQDYVRPWRRVKRWIIGRLPERSSRPQKWAGVVGYKNPLDPPQE